MKKNTMTILAFLIAPLFATFALLTLGTTASINKFLIKDVFFWTVIIYIFTLGITLIVGLPTYYKGTFRL